MRTVTRNFLVGLGLVLVALLALGALPSLLKSGDPYYLQATPIEAPNGTNATAADGGTAASAINVSGLSESRYPYTTAALANASDGPGRSGPYWRGPVGLKGAFTHSPFDELDALRFRSPGSAGEGLVVVRDGQHFRLAVIQR